LMYGML